MPPMAKVELTSHLKTFFPHLGSGDLRVEAATVAEVVRALETQAPGIGGYICDERGRLRRHVNIFVEEDRIIDRESLSDPVEADTRVFIFQALSGG